VFISVIGISFIPFIFILYFNFDLAKLFLYDYFYDACDELGIMLYHDMMYNEFPYPDNRWVPKDTPMQDAELRHQIRRLSHHPSIVVWLSFFIFILYYVFVGMCYRLFYFSLGDRSHNHSLCYIVFIFYDKSLTFINYEYPTVKYLFYNIYFVNFF
jgi:hypothetical protein